MRTAPLTAAVLLGASLQAAAQSHPLARHYPLRDLGGRWNGVNLELRSDCAAAQNNGNRGTYAQFDVIFAETGELAIAQAGVTGLSCEYRGRYAAPHGTALEGTYTCTDGKQGSFRGQVGPFGSSVLHLRFTAQLTGSESCSIQGVLSMARLQP